MLPIRKKAAQFAARRGGYGAVARYSTGQHGKTGDEVHHFAGTSTEHGHQHAGPKSESIGVSVLLAIDSFIC
jgi:hypothetical protein